MVRLYIRERIRKRLKSRYPHFYARLTREYPLVPVGDRLSAKPPSMSIIPKKVYQTWEYGTLGKTHYQQIEKFRDLNPEFDFIFFDSKQRDQYMEEYYAHHPIGKVYTNSLLGMVKADIWRYCVLCERGGLYFDSNRWCAIPLRSLFSDITHALISFESNVSPLLPSAEVAKLLTFPHNSILSWALFYEKGHPFLRKMIENIVDYYPLFRKRVFDNPKQAILKLTGPLMLTKSVYEALGKNPGIPFEQAGIDLNGVGNLGMEGDWVLRLQVPHYASFNHKAIVE